MLRTIYHRLLLTALVMGLTICPAVAAIAAPGPGVAAKAAKSSARHAAKRVAKAGGVFGAVRDDGLPVVIQVSRDGREVVPDRTLLGATRRATRERRASRLAARRAPATQLGHRRSMRCNAHFAAGSSDGCRITPLAGGGGCNPAPRCQDTFVVGGRIVCGRLDGLRVMQALTIAQRRSPRVGARAR